MKTIFVAFIFSLIPLIGNAWDGYDWEQGGYIEIEKGNLVRQGTQIEFYDYKAGEYRYGDVESIQRMGSSTEVEVYDHESGEHRIFDMDD